MMEQYRVWYATNVVCEKVTELTLENIFRKL